MSDTSRKRSRKSKLVPRECTPEDDVNLQAAAKSSRTAKKSKKTNDTLSLTPKITEIYEKLIKNKLQDSPKKEEQPVVNVAPIQFHIKVEVEKCDEYSIQVISADDNLSKENEKSNQDSLNLDLLTYTLTNNKVINASKKIIKNSTNVADKILDIAVRNTIGHQIVGFLNDNLHEIELQEALEEWRAWQFRSFHREAPLFYKCYLCDKSWWHLSDFREHITEHPELNISLEKYEKHESNIIAYHLIKPPVRDIHTEGLCERCGKSFNHHKLNSRIQKKYYGIEGCTKQFFTCTSAVNHSATCIQCKQRSAPTNQCGICRLFFDIEEQLDQHLQLSHSVRSDVVIMSRYRNCKDCLGRFISFNLHVCGRRGPHQGCPYCFRNFPNKHAVELHIEYSEGSYECEVCQKVLAWDCEKYEHMLSHTDNYMVAMKCVKCEDFNAFISYDGAFDHRVKMHKDDKDTKHQNYFDKIIVPKSCMHPGPETPEDESSDCESECQKDSVPPFKFETVPEFDNEEENIKIKDEPEDFIIKEEPNDDYESQPYECTPDVTEYNPPDIHVKQEYEEFEYEEYEDDIIKQDTDVNKHLMVKQEPIEESELGQESLDTADNTQESNDSNREPESRDSSDSEPENGKARMYTCKKCGFKGKHKQYRNHIEMDCKKSVLKLKNLLCTKCNWEFSSMKKYLAHFVKHGYKCLSCPECLKQFYTFTKLTPHVQSHIKQAFIRVKLITVTGTKKKPEYQCKKCTEVVDADQFFEHWELHINDSPDKNVKPVPTRLHKTGEEQVMQDVINESIRRIQKQPKDCNQCQRHFNRINECKRHIIEHLLQDAYNHKLDFQVLLCQICSAGFVTPEKYKQHMREHASLPVYKCELCDRAFSDSSNFTKHKKVHNLKVLICDLCGKKFQTKLSLIKHMEMHKNSEPVTCIPCNKIFHFESTYRRHVRSFHEKLVGYRCVICNTRFGSLKLKWNHMWEVHKERKDQADCPICFQSFRKYSDVRAHAKSEHKTDVSVYSVKNLGGSCPLVEGIDASAMKNFERFLQNNQGFRIGQRETLIVYE